MSEGKLDLDNVISEGADKQAAQPEQVNENREVSADDFVHRIEAIMMDLQNSIASMHIAVRALSTRVSSLERHVSYLLEQDPKAGPKIKEHLAKLEKEAASHEQERSESGTTEESGQ